MGLAENHPPLSLSRLEAGSPDGMILAFSQDPETVKVSVYIIKKFIHHEEHEGNEDKINNLILHALHGYFVTLNTFTVFPAWENRSRSSSFAFPKPFARC